MFSNTLCALNLKLGSAVLKKDRNHPWGTPVHAYPNFNSRAIVIAIFIKLFSVLNTPEDEIPVDFSSKVFLFR